MVDKHDLKGTHWELGLTKVRYESETAERFMSESRDKEVRDAIRAKKEPESLQLGKLLRQSHITLSHRPTPLAKSEAQLRWVPQKIEVAESFADTNGAELRKSNIDLAVAESKSGKGWSSVNKSTAESCADQKFACKQPEGFQSLGEELRKSSVLLHAGRHDFRSASLPVHKSESKREFHPHAISSVQSFADTLGKELRTSSFDYSYGVSKSSAGWQSQQHQIMGGCQKEKWACKQPEGFYHLIAELKKSNITLGSDRTVYGSEGAKRPIKDDRDRHPAGHVPGL